MTVLATEKFLLLPLKVCFTLLPQPLTHPRRAQSAASSRQNQAASN